MDSVSRPEFAGIFDRVSAVVELAGATTPVFIENRMKIEIHRAKRISRDIKPARLREMRKYYWFKADQLDKLKEHDFAGRAIFEAHRDPNGVIANTLKFGREEATKRVRAQKRAGMRMAYYVPAEKEVSEEVAKGLAAREKLRRRWWRK